MEWWEAGLLGLLQGLTEFLPVSSSAHLVLGQELLGIEEQGDILFEVFVHLGTALSIVTLYAGRLKTIVGDTFRVVSRSPMHWFSGTEERLGMLIVLTMIPTGIVYLLLEDPIEAAFTNLRLVLVMLLVTGLLLLLTARKRNTSGELTSWKALLIGVAQSAAFLPGISRSGATICTALYQNVRPQLAADFSFLMAVPVILAASLVKGLDLLDASMQTALLPLAVGTLVAYISGIFAIKIVLGFVRRGRLHYFAYYCFGIGILGLILV